MTKLIIAGGREYNTTLSDIAELTLICEENNVTEIVSGGARGADKCGEIFAKNIGLPVKLFKANWEQHGRAAGPIRNREMAIYADAVVLFCGGRGTENMYKTALKLELKIFDLRGTNHERS